MNTRRAETNPQRRRRKHWAGRTHRVIAITSLIFLLVLALTGLFLNHADTLGLSKRHAAGPLVLRLYGIDAPPVDGAYAAGGIVFASADQTLYADEVAFAKGVHPLRGAVVSGDDLVIATASEFIVATSGGVLVERFAPSFPGTLAKLGSDGYRVVGEIQNRYFEFDPQSMSLAELESGTADGFQWSEPVVLDREQQQRIATAVLGQSLSWERVLSDVHSGRILPSLGRYIADLAAISLLYLCLSGGVLWFRRR